MGAVLAQENQSETKRKGRGGPRPGSGRPPLGAVALPVWARFENQIRRVSRRFFTDEMLSQLMMAEPQRFLERVLLPLVLAEKRVPGQVRVGMKFGEGSNATQFVLDLGADTGMAAEDQARLEAQVLQDLNAMVRAGGGGLVQQLSGESESDG